MSLNSTVNLCALDLSKAFDRMNHYGLFIKLMVKRIPQNLLELLENWFRCGSTCVKWGAHISEFFALNAGIRQGGVLSPYLFALYIDSVVDKVRSTNVGCTVNGACLSILLYANDIILLAPTVMALQQLVMACEDELSWLDMHINVNKTFCIRIGPKYRVDPAKIVTRSGLEIEWADTIRYLGIYLRRHSVFMCCLDNHKRSFYRSFNAIYGKIGRVASEEVIIQLVQSKCVPVMLYCLEACPLKKSQLQSLENVIVHCFMKIFHTRSKETVNDCIEMFNLNVRKLLDRRRVTFLKTFATRNDRNTACCAFKARCMADLHCITV